MDKYTQIFNERLTELIGNIPFPFDEDKIHIPTFNDFVLNALPFFTETMLDCKLDEYAKVHLVAKSGGTWFMPEMFIALTAIKSLSPKDSMLNKMGCIDLDMWIERKKQWNALSRVWESKAAPYVEDAKRYVEDATEREKREFDLEQRKKKHTPKLIHL